MPEQNLATQNFVHPQATHTVFLDRVSVAYVLVRSSRKSISLEVADNGLIVRAPLRTSAKCIESVVQDKAAWVLEKLAAQQSRQQRKPIVIWQNGLFLPYLGGTIEVRLHSNAQSEGDLLVSGEQRWVLHLPNPVNSSQACVRAVVHAWWLRQARQIFTQRLQHFAPSLGVQWRSLRLANARTRWGSAKSDGSIMLNWRLLHYEQSVLDYVVVHELAHLREMNHSPRFWAHVAQACPDYAAQRAKLRLIPAPDWT